MLDYSQAAYGACFAEIGVDIDSGETRLRRMLGVFAAGRILNAQTARSQAIGGLIWGLGSALHEESAVDERSAGSSTTTWPATMCPPMPMRSRSKRSFCQNWTTSRSAQVEGGRRIGDLRRRRRDRQRHLQRLRGAGPQLSDHPRQADPRPGFSQPSLAARREKLGNSSLSGQAMEQMAQPRLRRVAGNVCFQAAANLTSMTEIGRKADLPFRSALRNQ